MIHSFPQPQILMTLLHLFLPYNDPVSRLLKWAET